MKEPRAISAIEWTGLNLEEVKSFVGDKLEYSIMDTAWEVGMGAVHVFMKVNTPIGTKQVLVNDYIIKDELLDFYIVTPIKAKKEK